MIISVVLAGIGLSSLAASLWSGRRDRLHDRAVRWEQRRQERLEDAYVTILEYVNNRIASEAAKSRPLGTPPTELVPPVPSEIAHARALAAAHASEPVRQLLDAFFAELTKIKDGELELHAIDQTRDSGQPGTATEAEHYADLLHCTHGGAIPTLRAIEERLHEQVRRELLDGGRASR